MVLGLPLQCFSLAPAASLFLASTCPLRLDRVNHIRQEHDARQAFALSMELGDAPIEDRRFNPSAGGGQFIRPQATERARLRRRRRGHSSHLSSSSSEDTVVPPQPKATGESTSPGACTAKATAPDGLAAAMEPGASWRACLLSEEALSLFHNPDTGSDIWLVGVEHTMEGYRKFVERVIREVKPDTVMLELCVDRATDPCYLPIGEATQDEDGLWWFTPNTIQWVDAAAVESQDLVEKDAMAVGVARGSAEDQPGAPRRRLRARFSKALANLRRRVVASAAQLVAVARSALFRLVYVEDEMVLMENNEMWAACCEAQACGARILLGDRDNKMLDEGPDKVTEDIEVASWTEKSREDFERYSKGMAMLLRLIDRRLAHGFKMPMTRAIMRKYGEWHRRCMPIHFASMTAERDKFMADNLLSIGGNQTTVAVVGFTHLDGIEELLAARGWEPQAV